MYTWHAQVASVIHGRGFWWRRGNNTGPPPNLHRPGSAAPPALVAAFGHPQPANPPSHESQHHWNAQDCLATWAVVRQHVWFDFSFALFLSVGVCEKPVSLIPKLALLGSESWDRQAASCLPVDNVVF